MRNGRKIGAANNLWTIWAAHRSVCSPPSNVKSDGLWLAPARLVGREVIGVFEDRAHPKPSYMMWLEWHDGRISFIRDYRYIRHLAADAELAPDAEPAGDGVAH